MAAPPPAAEPPARVRIRIPKHAMGMLIGSKGANFRDIQDIPELSECLLDQPRSDSGGVMTATGSVRACVVAADRVGKIIDASFERNVSNHFGSSGPGPARNRYERPSMSSRMRRYDSVSAPPQHSGSRRRSPTPDSKAPTLKGNATAPPTEPGGNDDAEDDEDPGATRRW